YTANIPGAVSFSWTVPATWYGLTGQGAAQITVTCNGCAGPVCAEGFDSIGSSLGTQCLNTISGAPTGGGGNWHLNPSGNNPVCNNVSSVNVTPTIVYDGGGGGCMGNCGGVYGTPNPNVVFALYSGTIFQGIMGTSMTLGFGTFYAAYVDTTSGRNFPQAVQVGACGGCGGSGSGTFSINQITLMPWVSYTPNQVCIGDTVFLTGNGTSLNFAAPSWSVNSGLTPISSVWNIIELQAIVTGTPASVNFTEYFDLTGIFWGTCEATITQNINVINCPASASFQSSNTTICENGCINFTNASVHSTSFQWSFPGATPDTSTDINPTNICYSTPGTYDVQLVATNPIGSDTLLLSSYITVYPAPPAQGISQSGDTLFANAGAASYQWYFNTFIIPGATDYFYIATSNGDYNLIATDANGCEVEAVIFNVAASLQSTVDSQQLTIFPNPVEDKLVIGNLKSGTAVDIFIYNLPGEKVFSAVDCRLRTVDCGQLTTGMYYLEISVGEKVFRTKFVKQ
ncbi:MAG: T9SS type A sorting domain-containing protein, partial [Bacteroidota bacterium]